MFKTTLELESSRKGNGVNSFELELKEKEIVRLHGVHEEELHNITKERNTIEVREDAQKNCFFNVMSNSKGGGGFD